jgi:hypothetical protein
MTLQFLKNLHAFQFSSFLIYMHFAAIDIYIYIYAFACIFYFGPSVAWRPGSPWGAKLRYAFRGGHNAP